jgi:hypothetical protein
MEMETLLSSIMLLSKEEGEILLFELKMKIIFILRNKISLKVGELATTSSLLKKLPTPLL